jgi:predicted  nucleic acid-binding Zn-ribbon protein
MPDVDQTEVVHDVKALSAENKRLRRLVGPLEQSYDDLRTELEAASKAIKIAEQNNGELRGEIMELTVALAKARHNIGKVHRIVIQRATHVVGRAIRGVQRRLATFSR